jgi:hypothetical protein
MDSLIENLAGNEQLKLVTFGEQLTVLRDFTSDRYELANAAAKFEFNDQKSRIYDAIYNTIPQVQPIDGAPCYYRTILITDGIDDTASGITKEELYLRLQAEKYPIDVVQVSKAEQTEPEKELSALTRISAGRYANIYPGADVSALSLRLAVGGLFWIRAEVPASLLDGSTRQVDISDGSHFVRFDVKVSAYEPPMTEVPAVAEPTAEPPSELTAELTHAPTPEPTAESVAAPSPEPIETPATPAPSSEPIEAPAASATAADPTEKAVADESPVN